MSNFVDKKAALFGKAPKETSGKTSGTATSKPLATPGVSSTPPTVDKLKAPPNAPVTSTLTPAFKTKKIAEAREWSSRAMKHLQTSMFQWNPDYLAAAPCFENASNVYKSIDEVSLACDCMLQSADANEKAGCLSAAAVSFAKAAQLCQTQKLFARAADNFERAAELYGIDGKLENLADMLAKAAREAGEFDKTRAIALYNRACLTLYPKDAPAEYLNKTHPKVLDIFREFFSFLIKQREFATALEVAERLLQLFLAFESMSSACKLRAAVTVVQLSVGDVVQADQTFLQHLSDSAYLSSKECKLAEDLVTAFKNRDVDLLDAAQRSQELTFLDRDVQTLARELSLLSTHSNWEHVEEEVPVSKPLKTPTAPVQQEVLEYSNEERDEEALESNSAVHDMPLNNNDDEDDENLC